MFWGFVGGVACFVGCWGIGVTCFDTLYCLIDAWCLVIWLNVGLLVINYLLRTVFYLHIRVQLQRLIVLLVVWFFDLAYL